MQIYILIACDRLEEKQEKKLKENLPDILLAMKAYAESLPIANVVIINKCDDLDVEDWQLGIEQSVKKNKQLQEPLTLFNGMSKKFGIDMEIGAVVKGKRKAVSYFGASEGKGDSFMISQYLGL